MQLNEGDAFSTDFFLPQSGIYAIVHRETKQAYIGQSANIILRWANHVNHLTRGEAGVNPNLAMMWHRDGPGAFYMEILEYCEPDMLLARELEWIKVWHKRYGVFNSNIIGPNDVDRVLEDDELLGIAERQRARGLNWWTAGALDQGRGTS